MVHRLKHDLASKLLIIFKKEIFFKMPYFKVRFEGKIPQDESFTRRLFGLSPFTIWRKYAWLPV